MAQKPLQPVATTRIVVCEPAPLELLAEGVAQLEALAETQPVPVQTMSMAL